MALTLEQRQKARELAKTLKPTTPEERQRVYDLLNARKEVA